MVNNALFFFFSIKHPHTHNRSETELTNLRYELRVLYSSSSHGFNVTNLVNGRFNNFESVTRGIIIRRMR